MKSIRIGKVEVSRFIVGSNPFSGFSHQTPDIDKRMRHYFTTECIKQTLKDAEAVGITAVIGRADFHVCRILMEHWDEGGKLRWLAQTCPELGTPEVSVDRAVAYGASGVHVHGGYADFLLAQGRIEEAVPVVERIHKAGVAAGLAGHNPEVFRWAEKVKLPVDYYMCSYYNAAHRDKRAEHVSGMSEWFLPEDRKIMTELIQDLSKPVIHYKVMAAGRNDPRDALRFVVRALRPSDAVCVGVYTEKKPDMLAEDVRLFEEALAAEGKA